MPGMKDDWDYRLGRASARVEAMAAEVERARAALEDPNANPDEIDAILRNVGVAGEEVDAELDDLEERLGGDDVGT